jgi:hypothetical protein
MIETMTILRCEKSIFGTFGIALLDGEAFCVTLEEQDNNNVKNISCIPEDTYACVIVNSVHFGKSYKVLGVKDRTNILFHVGNTIEDTRGCILLGRSFGTVKGTRGILTSSATCRELLVRGEEKPFTLTIKDISENTSWT